MGKNFPSNAFQKSFIHESQGASVFKEESPGQQAQILSKRFFIRVVP